MAPHPPGAATPHRRAGHFALGALPVLLLVAAACGGGEAGPISGPNPGPDTAVAGFMAGLPDWNSFSPLAPEQDATPTATPPMPLPDTVVTDTLGDDGSTRHPIPPVTYSCSVQEYSLAKTPDELVMYSPDTDILWPGALIQGKSHREPIGSLLGLTISQRTPINVSIPELAGGNNFRTVDNPNQATVASAISEMVGNATTANLGSPSSISFKETTSYSAQQFALSAKLSGKYLGFTAAASGGFSRASNETTVSVHFVEKMFTALVAPPQTPDAFFSSDFTGAVLQQQVSQGNIGPDNIPVYVSKVVYGRMMIYNFTSTASRTDIEAAIDAAYNVGFANVSASLRTKYQKILRTATVTVQTLGGPSQAALDVIRTGDRSQFFTSAALLTTAVPLSYEFKGLSNGNPIAKVTEATTYSIKECTAQASTPGTFNLLPLQTQATSPFVPDSILIADVTGDGSDDLVFNQLGGSNRFYIAQSQGNGSFTFGNVITHPDTPTEGWANYEVAAGDINGDGLTDLVWNYLGQENKTYLGIAQTDGSWAFPGVKIHPNMSWGPYRMAIADVDNDGDDDIIWAETSGRRIYVAQANGTGGLTFLPFQDHPAGGSGAPYLLVGNIDGKFGLDLVFNRLLNGSNTTWAAPADGVGQFTLPGTTYTNGGGDWRPYRAFLADVDNQAGDDLIWMAGGEAVTGNNSGFTKFVVKPSNGTGGFAAAVPTQTPNGTDPTADVNKGPFAFLVGDFNGDQRADVFWNTLNSTTNRSFVGLGLSNATLDFSPQAQDHQGGENWALFTVHSGDFNGDGRTDVAWIHPAVDNKIYVGLGQQ